MLPFHTVVAIENFPSKRLPALRGDSIRERLYFPERRKFSDTQAETILIAPRPVKIEAMRNAASK